MRNYATVSPQFWTGQTGRFLRKYPDAQRLALYLMTCPSSNMIGLYYLPIPTICHELSMSPEGASEGLRRVFEGGFADYDAESEIVFVFEMARFQVAEQLVEKDNRIKAVEKQLGAFSKSRLYMDFLKRYAEPFNLALRSPSEAPSGPLRSPFEGPSEPLRSQDQDQDQDQDPFLPETGDVGLTDQTKTPAPPVPDPEPTKPKTKAKSKAARVRDLTFDAIAEVTGLDGDTSAGSLIGKVAAELKQANPPYTAEDVFEFQRRFWELCDHARKDNRQRPTVNEIGRYIGLLRAKDAVPIIKRPPQDRVGPQEDSEW